MDKYDEYLRLLLKHESGLRAFIGSVVRDHHLREDLVQDVATTCWKQFHSYDRSRSFGAWARGIASNLVKQRKKQSSRFPVTFDPAAIEAILEAFDRTEAETPPRLEALTHCLEKLPEKSRRLLEHRYGDAMRPEEIAAKLRNSRDAVYKALARIRTKLEDCIQRWLSLEDAR